MRAFTFVLTTENACRLAGRLSGHEPAGAAEGFIPQPIMERAGWMIAVMEDCNDGDCLGVTFSGRNPLKSVVGDGYWLHYPDRILQATWWRQETGTMYVLLRGGEGSFILHVEGECITLGDVLVYDDLDPIHLFASV